MKNSQYKEAVAALDVSRGKTQEALEFSNHTLSELQKITTWTDDHALFLANICVHFDEHYGVGRGNLCLEWLLDHYVAFEFEKNVLPLVVEIRQALESGKHTFRNKFEYFDGAEAYYVPNDETKVLVFGQSHHDRPTYLVIGGSDQDLFHKFYVRQIWPQTKRDSIGGIAEPTLAFYRKHDFKLGYNRGAFYGDCRDEGHIMTYERVSFLGKEHGKCDNVSWDMNAPLHWFFEVNSLHTEVVGESDGR